jgi:hypothetical protein
MLNKKTIIIISIIVLSLGAFLRFHDLGKQSYWMDEGYTINAVISGQENGFTAQGASILDSGKSYACQTYCLPTIGLAKIFGNNATSYRLLSAIFGFIFIFVIYRFAQVFFKSNAVALLSAFFVALSYWQIAWSREARWYTELEVFFWLALLFFYLFCLSFRPRIIGINSGPESSSKRISIQCVTCFVFSIIFSILAITTHKLAYLLPFIMLAWFTLSVIPAKAGIQASGVKRWIPAFAGMTIMLIIFIAFIEFVLGFHFITNSIGNIKFHYNLPYYLSFYLRNYWQFIIVAIYGLFTAQGEEKKKHLMLWSAFSIYFIPLSFLTGIVHYRYLFHVTPVFYLAAALTMQSIFHVIPAKAGIHSFSVKPWIPGLVGTTLIVIFFATGQGLLYPKSFYALESDDPSKLPGRPYYAYTPQPNWNKAYEAIKENIKPDEIIISSHPHFNKIFLNQPGYWIKYDYLGLEKTVDQINENKEYYVGAEVINNLEELKKITSEKHGYIIFDYMSADGRISAETIQYIQKNLNSFFYEKTNSYSQIWVYKF